MRIEIEDLLDVSTATENVYPTLEDPAGTEEAQARADRFWREKTCRSDEEKRLFRGSTRRAADKRQKSKMFLSLGKQGQRYFFQKNPISKIVDITFAELWKLATNAFYREPNVTNRRFILFGRIQRDNE